MNNKIYVIRWLSRIDGEEECGNFEVCYTDEAKARKAMIEDMKKTKADWEKSNEDYLKGINETVKERTLGPNGEIGCCDYAGIWIEDGNGEGTYDYHDWWIDALDVAE